MILIDHSEPVEIVTLISQAAPVTVTNLNQTKRSDYFFLGGDGRTRQWSRKQAIELLGDIDEAERQIRDYYDQADENNQVVEGIISSVKIAKAVADGGVSVREGFGSTYGYKVEANGYIHGRAFPMGITLLQAWFYSLSQQGVMTYFTTNQLETAKLIVTAYHNSQKTEHTTLQRYTRPRVQIHAHDPFIRALLALSKAYSRSSTPLDVGEVTAKALAVKYHSILDIAMATEKELCECEGVGAGTAKKILKALGREV